MITKSEIVLLDENGVILWDGYVSSSAVMPRINELIAINKLLLEVYQITHEWPERNDAQLTKETVRIIVYTKRLKVG